MDACRRASVVDLRAAVTTPRGGGAYCTVVVIVCIPYLRYRRVSNTIEGRPYYYGHIEDLLLRC